MTDDKKLNIEEKERQCRTCGRILPIEKFKKARGRDRLFSCKECIGKKMVESRRRKSLHEIIESGLDDSMKIERKYKQIEENRKVDEKESGIPAIANDEVFARLLY